MIILVIGLSFIRRKENSSKHQSDDLYIIGRFCVCVCHEKVTKFFFFTKLFLVEKKFEKKI